MPPVAIAKAAAQQAEDDVTMRYFLVRITGRKPLLMNRFLVTDLDRPAGKKRMPLSPEQAAAKSRYLSADQKWLIMPGENVWRMIVNASGSFRAEGQKRKTLKSYVPGAVEVYPEELRIRPADDYAVDTRTARNRNAGKSVGIAVSRARVDPPWDIVFILGYAEEDLDHTTGPQGFRSILAEGGRRIGLGSYRPENCGRFGKFRVADFKEVPQEQVKA